MLHMWSPAVSRDIATSVSDRWDYVDDRWVL